MRELDRLTESEFPYEDSKEALQILGTRFRELEGEFTKLGDTSDPEVVAELSGLSLRRLHSYLPHLGFILRSTNVRNGFEVFHPFLRMAAVVLGSHAKPDSGRTRLLLSSEWDYSPFTYPVMTMLPGFVMIGTPAPESSNPLLLPLAGHELGHTYWNNAGLDLQVDDLLGQRFPLVLQQHFQEFQTFTHKSYESVTQAMQDLIVLPELEEMRSWALHQAEEMFCDFLGLALFGESYLSAFAYLLAPGVKERLELYPAMRTRAKNLVAAAQPQGYIVPDDYETTFDDDTYEIPRGFGALDKLKLKIADALFSSVATDLLKLAGEAAPVELRRDTAEVARVLERFRRVVPAESARSVADIVNAAWIGYRDDHLWEAMPVLHSRRRDVLRELVLKNLEVFEYEHLMKEHQGQ